jgi:tungstate transport system ATP-binding protein
MSAIESNAAPKSILPLRAETLRFDAADRCVLGPVSFTLEAGRTTVVLGANGAGKSLLLRLLHGLLQPTAGAVHWNAINAMQVRHRQAMVFQRPVLLRRSALDNITYALALAGVPRQQRAAQAMDALNTVGLAHVAARPARLLSGGEQQRVALARVWALSPEVLFLDEPTSSLDPQATHEIETVIRAFDAAGTKVVLVTHNLAQARRLGDEVLFMHAGKITEHTAMDIFFSQPSSSEARAFLQGEAVWR